MKGPSQLTWIILCHLLRNEGAAVIFGHPAGMTTAMIRLKGVVIRAWKCDQRWKWWAGGKGFRVLARCNFALANLNVRRSISVVSLVVEGERALLRFRGWLASTTSDKFVPCYHCNEKKQQYHNNCNKWAYHCSDYDGSIVPLAVVQHCRVSNYIC